MNSAPFTPIARTVLYEGQVLYPYRPSALKNQQQWNFGTLFPPAYPDEPSSFRLEALIESWPDHDGAHHPPQVELQLCFLHQGAEQHFPCWAPGSFPGAASAGIQFQVDGKITALDPGLWRLDVDVSNLTPMPPAPDRAAALPLAMQSAHLRCALERGDFVSAQDPGPERAAAAGRCICRGVYPVLVGPRGQRQFLLAAPIILEDYPRIAPQSVGDFCDATEMDEMLLLRVLTLTDAEREEMRAAGGEPARILERCLEAGALPERLADLHGGVEAQDWDPFDELRSEPPESVALGHRQLRVGDRVRLHPDLRPGHRSDIFDQVLAGKTARIQAIEQDLEGNIQLAVVADDDPGRDLGHLKQTGHRFFYTLSEVEPLELDSAAEHEAA